jgi:hypothetical protein
MEQAFTAAAIMLYSGGPLNVILSGGHSQGELQIAAPNYKLTSYFYLLTYLIVSALLFIRWKQVIRSIPYGILVWPLVILAGVSYLWSDIPGETLSNTITLTGTTLFGTYIATRYSPRQQLQILGWGFGLIVVLSFVYGILLP